MKLRLFSRAPKTKVYGEVTATPALTQMLSMLDGSPAGYGSIYRAVTPVRTVIDFIADAVAVTPLKVYRRTGQGRPEIRNHGLAELLREPNADLTTRTLIWRTTADLAIYGNAYWRKMLRADGTRQLVPLPVFRVTPRGGDLLRAGSYDFFSPNGLPPQNFGASEIVHFRLYDPEDPRIGSSKLQALRTIVLEEIEASKYRRGFWTNNAKLAGALQHPGQLSTEAMQRLREGWENTYSGAENAGKTAILEEGMSYASFGANARDSEFIEGREFVLEATARAFNLPLSLLGLTETATYASQREFHKQLYTDVLPPWFELITSEIENQLLPWFADTREVYTEFVVESKLRGDFLDQASVLNTAVGRPWMVVREARVLQNLPDRGEETDDELVVPVGPNYALEGMDAPELAEVTSLPATRAASRLVAFFERQERSVMPRMGAHHDKAFDRGRWDRELTEIVGSGSVARRVNLETEVELASGHEPRDVFERARRVRAAQIAEELSA